MYLIYESDINDWLCIKGPTSIINKPAIIASHWILLLDDTHKIAFLNRNIQILSRIEVPLSLEKFLRAIAGK